MSDYGIHVRQPVPHDIVGSELAIAALGTAFEGSYGWRLINARTTIAEGFFTAGGMGYMSSWTRTVEVNTDYSGPATFELFGDTGEDHGEPVDLQKVAVIVIAGASGYVPYQVKRGDTLSKIAREHDSTVKKIALASRVANPDLIRVGQLLRIPT